MKRLLCRGLLAFVLILLLLTAGGSVYMLRYALEPEAERTDTARCFRRFIERHPEAQPWLDSLKACHALCDTFATMPSGERHHAYLIPSCHSEAPVCIVLHGWRGCAIDFLDYARLFHRELGCHVLLPDLHAHGLSEGKTIGMGWQERHDVVHWMQIAAERFGARRFVVHGVSMGAATAMNVSAEPMPEGVDDVRFVEDCGYTSVWDEFSHEMKARFGLPPFPILHASSMLCGLLYGWNFSEASSLRQVAECRWPMLFIHGDSDDFVPSPMVHPLFQAKPEPKSLWVTAGTHHACSLADYPDDYLSRLRHFIPRSWLP